jgi:predicted phage gp36 major capsid-like protein
VVVCVASGKVRVLSVRVIKNAKPGGQFTVAACLSTNVVHEGKTCIETASVPCAEVAFAGTESASNSAAHTHRG